eukprot:gene4945-6918_t
MWRRITLTPIKNIIQRQYRTNRPAQNSFMDADKSVGLTKFYHSSAIGLAVLTPLAFLVTPTAPIDIILGLFFPIHSHIALNYVISDYVPKAFRAVARTSMIGVTVITIAGLMRLNIQGAGLTQTIKSLWTKENSSK